MRLKILILATTLWSSAQALDPGGNGPTRAEAVALYVFSAANIDTNTWTIHDLAPNPLDLQVVNTGAAVTAFPTYLQLTENNLIRSINPADKITSACKASNELTVEMWLTSAATADKLVNHEDDMLAPGYYKQSLRLMSLGDSYFKEYHNFGLFQGYNMGNIYKGTARTSTNSTAPLNAPTSGDYVDPLQTDNQTLLLGKMQHIIFVRTAGGTATMYASDANGNDAPVASSVQGFSGNFSNWFTSGTNVSYDTPDDSVSGPVSRALDMRLSIGNDSSSPPDFSKPIIGGEGPTKHSRNWPWIGNLYMAAVYCKALSATDILGTKAPNTTAPPVFTVDLNMPITNSVQQASTIYTRITGVKTPLSNPVITQMAALIESNQALQAATLATQDPNFLNITVRDMAAQMSTREETVNLNVNDFIATMVGAVRDGLDMRTLLSSNIVYVADPTKAAVPSNLINDQLMSSRHYDALTTGGYNLAAVLMPSTQFVYDGVSKAVANPDPAGLLTTRTWLGAHAIAGTNRRMIQYSFQEFLCTPITSWANASGSDAFIGRDVDRAPGGSYTTFTTTCRACHSRMDPMRGAFADWTFSNNFAKHSFVDSLLPAGANEDASQGMAAGLSNDDPALKTLPNLGNVNYVADKMNHNWAVFPGGRVIIDNSFQNSALEPWGQSYFGWRGPTSGNGASQYGAMLAASRQFSTCMAQRVFASVCKRPPQDFDGPMINQVSSNFESNGFKLDYLFKNIVITPNCIGASQ